VRSRFSSLRFTKEHEWIKVQNGIGTVGITNFAQNALGDVVFVDLPDIGAKFNKKDTIAGVESVKVRALLFAFFFFFFFSSPFARSSSHQEISSILCEPLLRSSPSKKPGCK
jgi:hypothetical protein